MRYCVYLCILIVTSISTLCCMEQASVEAQNTIAPYLTATPYEITKAFVQKKIDLDQLFAHIFPPEITRKIVKDAYQCELQDYFFSPDTAQRFFTHKSCSSHSNPKKKYAHCITSYPNVIDEYPHLQDATCAIRPKAADAYWSHWVGFKDGSVHLYTKNGIEFEYPFGTTHSLPAVTAFGIGTGSFHDENSTQPFMLMGYENGLVGFNTRKQYKIIHEEASVMSAVSHISCGPLPNSWFVVSGDTTTLWLVAFNTNIFSEDVTFQGAHFNINLPQISGIGTYKNSIVVQSAQKDYWLIAPYSIPDYNFMHKSQFSPLQASCIYRIMQQQQMNASFALTEEDAAIFKLLPQTVREVIEMKSKGS
jgi:hypothetical protein